MNLSLATGLFLGATPVDGVFLGGARVSAQPTPTARAGLAKTPLPDDTAVDPGSVLAVQGLVDQAARSGTYQTFADSPPAMNITGFSIAYQVIERKAAAAMPKLKVAVTEPQSALVTAIGNAGLPISASFVPQIDSDGTAGIYVPGEVRGPGKKGVYIEFTGLDYPTADQVTAGYAFQARQITRVVDADINLGQMFDYFYQFGASFDDPTSDPYAVPDQSTGAMMYHYWGASAFGANPAFIAHCLLPQDLRRGVADHVLGLMVADCAPGSRFPGIPQRYDGTVGGYPFTEGAWFRFPAGAVMPTNLPPLGEVMWRTVQKHGFLVVDKTRTCLAVRATPDCAGLLTASSPIDGRDWSGYAFTNFPWADLELTVPGSLVDYHPRTYAAVRPAPGYDLNATSGLVRYHRAGDIAVTQGVADTDPVVVLPDRKAGFNVAAPKSQANPQLNAPARPTYGANTMGAGRPALRLDGVANYMQSLLGSVPQPFTVVLVAKFDTAKLIANTLTVAMDTGVPAGGNRAALFFGNATEILMLSDAGVFTGLHVTGGRDRIVAVFNGASSFVRLNGAQSGALNPGATALDGLAIGAHAGSSFTDGFAAMDLEVLGIYGRQLSGGEISAIETGLASTS